MEDDLTGACDVGAELLCWSGGVVVQPGLEAPHAAAAARGDPARAEHAEPDARTRRCGRAGERRARTTSLRVGPAWCSRRSTPGLRGQLGAEIDAAMDALQVDEAFVLPAIPESGARRTDGR